MKRLSRRIAALLSTTAMAVAFLVTGPSMVAQAAPVTATSVVSGTGFPTYLSQFTITRTVSNSTPTYGDIVQVTTRITRDTHGYLLYEVRDFTPACMEYQTGTAQANKGGDIEANAEHVRWDYWGGRVADPFEMTAEYKITCTPGSVATGGTWMKRAPAGSAELGNRNMGPTINVQKVQSSIDLSASPATVQVGQQVTLTAATTNIADGQTIDFRVNGTSIGTGTVQNNVAALTHGFSAPGSFQVTAHYAGTTFVSSYDSSAATVTVNKSASTVSIAASQPAIAQAPVPLTATTTGIADGQTIEFLVNGSVVGTAQVSGGTAVYNGWTPATGGDYVVQARYAGSATVEGQTSQQVMVNVVEPIQVTSTTLGVSPDPVPGQTSTLTATVTDGNDGDTVEFRNNGALLGTGTVSGGIATYGWNVGAALANQNYSLTAHYLGSPGYMASESQPVTGTVGLVQTTVSDVTAPATARIGTPVMLSATVTGGQSGIPVTFRDADGAELCSVTLGGGTTAACSWTPSAAGAVDVTAHYPGSSTTAAASSPTATTVTVDVRESSLTLSAPASAAVGQEVALSVEAEGIADDEEITFNVNGAAVGTGTVSGGQASVTWTPNSVGDYQVQAAYAGSDTVGASTSNTATVAVALTETQTSAVTASSDPVTGQPVTLSASVQGGAEGVTVEFRDAEGQVLCSDQLDADGAASCAWTPTSVGAVQVTAHYLGDATTASSQSPTPTTVTVGQGVVAAPSDLVVSPVSPSSDDAVVVSGSAPAGSSVTVTGPGGAECTVTANGEGEFSGCDLGVLPVGTHTLSAVATLNGVDSAPATVSVTVGQGVVAAPSDLVVSPASPSSDDAVVVSGSAPAGSSVTVTGPGGAECTVRANADGDFSCELGVLPVGADQEISAVATLNGVASPAATTSVTVTQGEVAAPTSLSASPNPATSDEPVLVSGKAAAGASVAVTGPGGAECTVTANADGDFSCELGVLPVGADQEISAVATLNGVASPAATTTVTVGQGAVAAPSDLVVSPASPLTDDAVVVSGSAPAGSSVTVTGPGGAECTVTANAQGEFSGCALGALPVGTHTLSAVANLNGVDSDATTVSVTVGQGVVAAPSDLVVSPASPSTDDAVVVSGSAPAGSSVTVTGPGGAECTVTANAQGEFSGCDLGALPVGTHTLSAVANLNGADSDPATVSVTVGQGTVAPVTDLSVSPSSPSTADSVVVSGSAPAGSTVAVSVDGVEICADVPVALDGSFACNVGQLAFGAHEVSAVATLNGVDSAPATTSVSVGQGVVAPVTGLSVDPGNPTSDQPVTVSGTAVPGASVVVTGPGGTSCTVTADAVTGEFECSLGVLPVGADQTISVVQTVNGVASEPATVSVSVGQGVVAPVTGLSVDPVNPTSDQPVTVSGTAVPGASVVVTGPGGTSCTVTADAVTGEFECSLGVLPVGADQTISVVQTVNGVASEPATVSVTVGQGVVAPVTGLSVDPVNPTSDQPVTVSGTATPGASVVVTGPGGTSCTVTADAVTGEFECSLGVLPAGEDQTISVTQTVNGVTSAATATTVSVTEPGDTTAPDAPTGITVTPQPAAPGSTVTVKGSAQPGSTIEVLVDGTAVPCSPALVPESGQFSCTFTAPGAGEYAVTVTATDEGGTSQQSASETLTVEAPVTPTDPSVTITPNPPVAGEVTEIEVEGEDGEEVVITIGGVEVCRETIVDGTAVCEWTPGAAGEVEIEIVVGDADPIIETVTVRPADTGGTGSLDMGSLEASFGSSAASSGSAGSLGSLSNN